MFIDSHIHIGQFYSSYYSPQFVVNLMKQLQVDYYAVSSTTICEENYPKVIKEFTELISIDGNSILPVMWITPDSLNGNIAWFLESNIKWKCLKIHPFLHPNNWQLTGTEIYEAAEIAREMSIPMLIHTGYDSFCSSGNFESIIKKYRDVIFILAHGRPENEAQTLIQKYENVYVDTAFMPIDILTGFKKLGLCNKVLWGSDMCIPIYYDNTINLYEYYIDKRKKLSLILNSTEYELITYKNAMHVFNIL